LYHGSGGVGLDADSKCTKQDRMRSQKNQSPHTSGINVACCVRGLTLGSVDLPVLNMIRSPDRDPTGFCTSEPDADWTGF